MARTFMFPAQYTRLVESNLALLTAEIGRDVAWRADGDEYVRKLAPVPEEMLEPDLTGQIVVVIVPAAAGDVTADLGSHLIALARTT